MSLSPAHLPALSDAEVQALGGAGFFVRDFLIGQEAAIAARDEALALLAAGRLRLAEAAISRGDRRHVDRSIRGDRRAWLSDAELGPNLARLRDALVTLGEAVSREAWLGLERHEIQLAHYEQGAAYVRHRDAFHGAESRKLTVITYLNPSWRSDHGGVLRLYPAPDAANMNAALTDVAYVDVPPVLDRTVVFLADRVEHEVLPAYAPRFAVTAWFYATPR